jgi:hypothetical protein
MTADKSRVIDWRLLSQKLIGQRLESPPQAVSWLGGVQAQDYQWAKWSIGLRTAECTDEDVERAIQNRQIVRTWMFRGTLHFVAAEDLSWLTALLAPGAIRRNARRYRQLELDDAAFTRSQNVIRDAIEADGPLTRAEIKVHLEKEGISAQGQQLPYLLQRAALDGLICQGSQHGSEPTYVLVSDWAGEQPTLKPAEALETLAVRYLTSHGPATQRDFAWWAGLTAAEARSALESASVAVPVEANGAQYWAMGDPPPRDVPECGHLLPRFDEWLFGYKGRSLVVAAAHTKRVSAGGGMPKPTVMVNGEIAGTWSYRPRKDEMTVSVQPFRNLESRERELIDRAARELSRFSFVPLKVRLDTGHNA